MTVREVLKFIAADEGVENSAVEVFTNASTSTDSRYPLTHSLTPSLPHSLTHSLTHSLKTTHFYVKQAVESNDRELS